MLETMDEIRDVIWRFRAQHGSYWRTPDPLSSLRYALTEAGEALDAHLRLDRPEDARNRSKYVQVEEELADCFIMLITSIDEDVQLTCYSDIFSFEGLFFDIATAAFTLRHGGEYTQSVVRAACMIYHWVPDLGRVVDSRLQRIFEKHVNLC